MKVKLAKSAGYCMGVIRAMDITMKEASMSDCNIFTFGPLIHNPQVIEILEQMGVQQLNEPEKQNGKGKLIIRAHGISPEKMDAVKSKGYEVKDATCPRVSRVQNLIKKYSEDGYSTVIVGDEGHAEVLGLLGFANDKGYVIKSTEEGSRLPDFNKLLIVAQTTFNKTEFGIIAESINKKGKEVKVYDTICDSTSRRQTEVKELAKQVDAMVIVGGRHSANTRRLEEISRDTGKPTFLVETDEELNGLGLERYKIVGVTAGASTPNWMISRVVDTLGSIKSYDSSNILTNFYEFIMFLGKSNFFVALGAASLYYSATVLQKLPMRLSNFSIAFLYVFAMHILNQFTDRKASEINDPAKVKFYQKHRKLLITGGILSITLALIGCWNLGPLPFILLFVSSMLGIAYRVQLIPKSLSLKLRYFKLKDIPGSKNLFVALAWATVLVIIPALNININLDLSSCIIAFIFISILVFIRAVLFDLWGIQGDMILGKETIPIILGEKRTKKFLIYLSVILAVILVSSSAFSFTSPLSYFQLIIILWLSIHLFLPRLTIISKRIIYEMMVDGTFILSGIITLLYRYLV
jgi:(E)-4-hydroxy-3-methyl-but-2-enyl pyrophosphate reductase